MGLASLKTVPAPEKKPDLVVDLSTWLGSGTIKFREPKANDLFPDANEAKEAKIHFPEFKDDLLQLVIFMGRTYIPDETESGQALMPWKTFGNLARENRILFYGIANAWGDAFKVGGMAESNKQVGNDSAE
jgi:hypothetical protein